MGDSNIVMMQGSVVWELWMPNVENVENVKGPAGHFVNIDFCQSVHARRSADFENELGWQSAGLTICESISM